MMLEFEFWDERGAHSQLRGRRHYFDFDRRAWIPPLEEEAEAV
jgi:hypothetical protein